MENEEQDANAEVVLEALRVQCRGYAEGADITMRVFEREEMVCMEFVAECGHTGAEIPLVDILKHAIVLHPDVLAQAYRELGREVPNGTGDCDSGGADDNKGSWGRYD